MRRLVRGTTVADRGGQMAQTEVDDDLWQEFHDVVNMTSRELRDWLR